MENISQIIQIMARLSELLRLGNEDEWVTRVDQYRMELPKDSSHVLSKILRLYGGMGSLTDIVLYRNGQPLISENNELAELRTKLYELCMVA
ncbi:DUF6966 domain-containing protein [Pseudomonas sp. Teo4]|uniref:DUF6966 domain-containing protein n=1 Tax=Pseudomonas sp. Teo4 TaxID=3064528 RepID=UPI002ABAC3EB|nr:hypothetical protein [Pseudomonas sp. Teo4]MDZ3994866.1 hypothetical protein [Pseudomonas sp. Teo4]